MHNDQPANEPDRPRESVWEYPRPPRVEPTSRRIRVIFNGEVVAETTRALRVLETSHPPSYYIPPADIRMEWLSPAAGRSVCEYKGVARYWSLTVGGRSADSAAWSYPNPLPGFEAIRDHLSFYAGRVDACYVDEERVQPQAGDFYGGWITSDLVGPFKGAPGTWLW